MDINNVSKAVIGIVIISIIILTFAIPVFDDMEIKESSIVNGGDRYSMLDTYNDSVTISLLDSTFYVEYDGTVEELKTNTGSTEVGSIVTNVLGQNFFFRFESPDEPILTINYQNSPTNEQSSSSDELTGSGPWILTKDKLWNANETSLSGNIVHGIAFIMNDDGDYVNEIGQTVPLSNSAIYGFGCEGSRYGKYCSISLDESNIVKLGLLSNLLGPVVGSSGVIVEDDEISYSDSMSCTFDPPIGSDETLSIFAVMGPYEVIVSDEDSPILTIIDILPLIMVIGVLIAAVGIFLHSRS